MKTSKFAFEIIWPLGVKWLILSRRIFFFSIQGISSLHQCSTSLQAKTFVHYMTLLAEIKQLLGDTLLCHHDSGSAVTCCVLMCTWQKMAYFKGSHTSAVFVFCPDNLGFLCIAQWRIFSGIQYSIFHASFITSQWNKELLLTWGDWPSGHQPLLEKT